MFLRAYQLSYPPNKIKGQKKGTVLVQITLCLKEKGRKKINPHHGYWFFNVPGPILRPNVCVLLDIGTIPGLNLLDIYSNVGGACDEIHTLKDKYGGNPLDTLGTFPV